MMVTSTELDQISALLQVLTDDYSPTDVEIGLDVTVSDTNGDTIGTVAYSSGSAGYVLNVATQ